MRTGSRLAIQLACGTLAMAESVVPVVGQRPPAYAHLLSDLGLLKDFRSKRASSWDRTGGNADWILVPPKGKHVLLDEPGAGCIKHIYWTYIAPDEAHRMDVFRAVVFRAYWDGADKPSIEAPLGDLFGVSNGMIRPIRSMAFTTNPGTDTEGQASWGFNCYLPMPFAKGARIELANEGKTNARIWFHIDYQLYDDASALPANAGRLHAIWHRECPTKAIQPTDIGREIENLTGDENYTILDVAGNGQFVGYFLTVVNAYRSWWGEGDDMVFIDGEAFPPSIHGTGSEEIFGGGACPTDEYTGPYTGFHCVENRAGYRWWGTNGMYRFYVTDPLRFRKSIRVTIEHGHGNDLANDYASVAFWYQEGVNTNLPPLAPLSHRWINFNLNHGQARADAAARRGPTPPPGAAPPSTVAIENDRYVLWLRPQEAGAVVRWYDKKLKLDLLRGYRKSPGLPGRWTDWHHRIGVPGGPVAPSYRVLERTDHSITIEGQSDSGLVARRTMRLRTAPQGVDVELTLRNTTDAPMTVPVSLHPELDVQGEYIPELWLERHDGWSKVEIHRRPQLLTHGERVDPGASRRAAIYVPQVPLALVVEYDPAAVGRLWFYFNADTNREHANLELLTTDEPIAAGKTRALRATYWVTNVPPTQL
jgi:hypothetical protein